MQLIDTHCHLTHHKLFQDIPELLQRAQDAAVHHCITIGTSIADGKQCREIKNTYPQQVFCSIGIDPFSCHEAGEDFPQQLQELDSLLASGDFVAIGEIGLDYHYDLNPHAQQIQQFELQLELAHKHQMPVIIHVRDAHEDMLSCLENHPQNFGVIHSFTGNPQEAERYLALNNWMLSFNGIATFKNAQEVAAAAKICPLDQLLIETDSPYLAPVPKRGKRCEPAFVAHTLEFLASIRQESVEEIAEHSTANAIRLFKLPITR
ncbi:MAG: TatD family hydrolase [Planctomycetes bacterium]|nr:TatD family hydrolase [Planctomycetota bacterium]